MPLGVFDRFRIRLVTQVGEYVCGKESVDVERDAVLPVSIFGLIVGEGEQAAVIFDVPGEFGIETQFDVGTVLALGLVTLLDAEPCGVEFFVVSAYLQVIGEWVYGGAESDSLFAVFDVFLAMT